MAGLAVGGSDPDITKKNIIAWFGLHMVILSKSNYEKYRNVYVHVHRPVIPHRVVDQEGRNMPQIEYSDDEGLDGGGAAPAATSNSNENANQDLYPPSDSDSDSEEDSEPTIDQRYTSAVAKLMEITTIEEFVYFIRGFDYYLYDIIQKPEEGKKECFDDWEKEKEIRIDKYWYWFYETILNNYDRKQHDNQRAVNDQIKNMDKTYLVKLRF